MNNEFAVRAFGETFRPNESGWADFALQPQPAAFGQEYTGTTGPDTQPGTDDGDRFNYWQGGDDTLSGVKGTDLFFFRDAFTAADSVNGGTGMTDAETENDTLILKGDYTADQVWNANTMTNIETLRLLASPGYSFFLDDNNIGAGQRLVVDASALTSGTLLHIDGSHETDGAFTIYGGDSNGSYGLGFGDDVVHAGSGDDSIFPGAGNDTVFAGGGDDQIVFNLGEFSVSDHINGGGDSLSDDLVTYFNADANIVLQPTTISNIEVWFIRSAENSGALNVSVTANNGNVGQGHQMNVIADSGANSTLNLTFDGSHERNGNFYLSGGLGDDSLTGGAKDDFFYTGGGEDQVYGGGGNDTIYGYGDIDAGDRIDGGKGEDTLSLGSDYSLFVENDLITHVEIISLTGFYDYTLTIFNEAVSGTGTLTIDGSLLSAHNHLNFDGGNDLDSHLVVTGGAGKDHLVGGAANIDNFAGGLGGDTLIGGNHGDTLNGDGGDDLIAPGIGPDRVDSGTGHDTIQYGAVSQSSGPSHDVIVHFDAAHDIFSAVAVTGINDEVTSGRLDSSKFNHDLAAAVDAEALHKHHAVLFTPNHGSLAGKLFLIVDANGHAGYQAGADYVFQLIDPLHLSQLGVGDFETS